MAFKFGGIKDETITAVLKHPAGWGILAGVFILLIALTVIYTQPDIYTFMTPANASEVSPEGFALTPSAQLKQTVQTLMHPTIVAIVIMFAIFAITVYMITHKGGSE